MGPSTSTLSCLNTIASGEMSPWPPPTPPPPAGTRPAHVGTSVSFVIRVVLPELWSSRISSTSRVPDAFALATVASRTGGCAGAGRSGGDAGGEDDRLAEDGRIGRGGQSHGGGGLVDKLGEGGRGAGGVVAVAGIDGGDGMGRHAQAVGGKGGQADAQDAGTQNVRSVFEGDGAGGGAAARRVGCDGGGESDRLAED